MNLVQSSLVSHSSGLAKSKKSVRQDGLFLFSALKQAMIIALPAALCLRQGRNCGADEAASSAPGSEEKHELGLNRYSGKRAYLCCP